MCPCRIGTVCVCVCKGKTHTAHPLNNTLSYHADPVRFQVAKEDLERRRRNRDFDEPLKVAHRLRRSLFTFPKFAISADDVPL